MKYRTLQEIKNKFPNFFSQGNNRFFGTRKVYKKGNFIILLNIVDSIFNEGTLTRYSLYHAQEDNLRYINSFDSLIQAQSKAISLETENFKKKKGRDYL